MEKVIMFYFCEELKSLFLAIGFQENLQINTRTNRFMKVRPSMDRTNLMCV
jgi:hypothetical protein